MRVKVRAIEKKRGKGEWMKRETLSSSSSFSVYGWQTEIHPNWHTFPDLASLFRLAAFSVSFSLFLPPSLVPFLLFSSHPSVFVCVYVSMPPPRALRSQRADPCSPVVSNSSHRTGFEIFFGISFFFLFSSSSSSSSLVVVIWFVPMLFFSLFFFSFFFLLWDSPWVRVCVMSCFFPWLVLCGVSLRVSSRVRSKIQWGGRWALGSVISMFLVWWTTRQQWKKRCRYFLWNERLREISLMKYVDVFVCSFVHSLLVFSLSLSLLDVWMVESLRIHHSRFTLKWTWIWFYYYFNLYLIWFRLREMWDYGMFVGMKWIDMGCGCCWFVCTEFSFDYVFGWWDLRGVFLCRFRWRTGSRVKIFIRGLWSNAFVTDSVQFFEYDHVSQKMGAIFREKHVACGLRLFFALWLI